MSDAEYGSNAARAYRPRERIVYQAVQHMRSRGPGGASLRAIVRDADAPWGSLRHYFPGGKDQLLTEALQWSGEYASARVQAYLDSVAHPTPGGLLEALADGWIADLQRRGFSRGCPIAAATMDAGGGPDVASATGAALERWEGVIVAALGEMDAPDPQRAANVLLSLLEGAVLLCRAKQSVQPLEDVKKCAELVGPW
ncbi:TetR/AcrR family transcriptional regulator [Tomitella gaofuii]|uniref:TetR/AcrR family transcriptional regulator n=1 Tax=Tomitella gaofuii TaxID=2760083 RepID=UPI0015FB8F22|nr:TetR/AcrR family transcriptional regulator [Tomitella gaofuii]